MDEFNLSQGARAGRTVRRRGRPRHGFMDLQERMSKMGVCQEVFGVKCLFLKDLGAKFNEAKRKADHTQDQSEVHRERCRRMSAEYGTAEEDLNDCLGRMGQLIHDTAGAIHALSCCTTERDCNGVKYIQKALDQIEDFQRRDTRLEVAEIILVECPR